MRVLYFAETLAGGPASYLNELIPCQLRHYDHVAVYCPENQKQHLAESGAHIHTFTPTRRNPSGLLSLYRQWVAFSKAHDFDVVHLGAFE